MNASLKMPMMPYTDPIPCDAEDSYIDVEVVVREHKTRANIMTAYQAAFCHKSSKNHKLKPRSRKRDMTKTVEAKDKAKAIKRSHSHAP